MTAFFAWTAWASVANRPDKLYSYTNNFPYDPTVGNRLTSDAVLWSALSVAMLLAGLAVVLTDEQWALPEKFVKFSFWGLNIGLALMVVTNLFPEGILQVWDVLENGYWHARSLEFIGTDRIRMLEWFSMPSHLILIILGVVPMVVASGLTYLKIRKQ